MIKPQTFITAIITLASACQFTLQAETEDINKDLDWLEVQKATITKIILFVVVLGILGLIVWKVWDV